MDDVNVCPLRVVEKDDVSSLWVVEGKVVVPLPGSTTELGFVASPGMTELLP